MEKDGDNGGKPRRKGVHLESVILTTGAAATEADDAAAKGACA
jgi:hypothetical protein